MGTLSLTKEARIYSREKTASLVCWFWENWTAACKGMKLEHLLRPYTKMNSKWIKDLNKARNYKLLEEVIDSTLLDINHSKILCDPPPRVIEIKTKINR